MKTATSLLIALCFMGSTLASCTGPEGLMGAQGEQGQPGEDGEDGTCTRTVHKTSSPITSDSFFVLDVPEITLDDMPLVAVYASLSPEYGWFELPFSFKAVSPHEFGHYCWFMEGAVCFSGCKDMRIKVVIVK